MKTYQTLRSAVNNYALREDYPFDEFLLLTESGIENSLRVNEMLVEKVTQITTPERKIKKPAGVLEVRSLKTMHKEDDFDNAVPISFSVIGDEIMMHDYIRDTWLVMQYFEAPPAITANNIDNAIIKKYPEIYLYGILSNLYKWVQDDEQYAKYLGDLSNEIILANENAHKEWGVGQEISVNLKGVSF